MNQTIKISEREKQVLIQLARVHDHECNVRLISDLAETLKLEPWQVRRAVRALARKGLAELVRGLINTAEEHLLAGSGYAATTQGVQYITETVPDFQTAPEYDY